MRLIVLCIRIIGPISRGNRSRISNNLCLSIRGWIYLDTDHISYIGTRKSVAYKRIGAVRYAGTKGISLCFIAAIKETLSRLCQGEQLDGKGKNDLVVSVSSNPFVRLPVTYIPSVARWYHRWYHSIRVTTIFFFPFLFFFFFFTPRIYLIVIYRVYCWKILAPSRLINDDNATIVEPSLE